MRTDYAERSEKVELSWWYGNLLCVLRRAQRYQVLEDSNLLELL